MAQVKVEEISELYGDSASARPVSQRVDQTLKIFFITGVKAGG